MISSPMHQILSCRHIGLTLWRSRSTVEPRIIVTALREADMGHLFQLRMACRLNFEGMARCWVDYLSVEWANLHCVHGLDHFTNKEIQQTLHSIVEPTVRTTDNMKSPPHPPDRHLIGQFFAATNSIIDWARHTYNRTRLFSVG